MIILDDLNNNIVDIIRKLDTNNQKPIILFVKHISDKLLFNLKGTKNVNKVVSIAKNRVGANKISKYKTDKNIKVEDEIKELNRVITKSLDIFIKYLRRAIKNVKIIIKR